MFLKGKLHSPHVCSSFRRTVDQCRSNVPSYRTEFHSTPYGGQRHGTSEEIKSNRWSPTLMFLGGMCTDTFSSLNPSTLQSFFSVVCCGYPVVANKLLAQQHVCLVSRSVWRGGGFGAWTGTGWVGLRDECEPIWLIRGRKYETRRFDNIFLRMDWVKKSAERLFSYFDYSPTDLLTPFK